MEERLEKVAGMVTTLATSVIDGINVQRSKSALTSTGPAGTQGSTISSVIQNVSSTSDSSEELFPYERKAEGITMLLSAAMGIVASMLIIVNMAGTKRLRTFTYGFMVHACILNALKSLMSVLFGLTLLGDVKPHTELCKPLGLGYFVIVTVSMFNLLAIVMTEAYTFYEQNVSEPRDDHGGGLMCMLFGLLTVYIGSIILHLGPTLIGGEFGYNVDIGNCALLYGKVENYIMQVIWISMVTLTLVVIFHYILRFHRQLSANQKFRISNLARNAAAYYKGVDQNDSIYNIVDRLKRKVYMYTYMALVYVVSWYPLFILTLSDYNYKRPRYLYRILTVLAWGHSSILPIIIISLDSSLGLATLCRRLTQGDTDYKSASPSQQKLTVSRDSSIANSLYHHNNNNNNNNNNNAVNMSYSSSSSYNNNMLSPGKSRRPTATVNYHSDSSSGITSYMVKRGMTSLCVGGVRQEAADGYSSDELRKLSDLDDVEVEMEEELTRHNVSGSSQGIQDNQLRLLGESLVIDDSPV